MPRIRIADLDMSDTLGARIIAAFRGLYPDKTVGMSDRMVVQAVLKLIFSDHLAAWEARQAAAEPNVAASEAADAANEARRQAWEAAQSEALADMHTTSA